MANLICHFDFNSTDDLSGNGHSLAHNGLLENGMLKLNGVDQFGSVDTITSIPDSFTMIIDYKYTAVPNTGNALIGCNYDSDGSNALLVGVWTAFRVEVHGTYSDIYADGSNVVDEAGLLVVRCENGVFTNHVYNGVHRFISHSAINLTGLRKLVLGGEYDGGILGDFAAVEYYEFKLFDDYLSDGELVALIPDFPAIVYPAVALTNPAWANKESYEQANPQPEQPQYLEFEQDKVLVACKYEQYSEIFDQRGEQREQGYYQSTTTVSGVPVSGVRVFCFTNNGLLLDETRSNAQGVYRFDNLLMSEKYMFVAQYDESDSRTQPVYLAVAADWQTPTAYQ